MCLPDTPALLGIAAIVTALARLVAAWRANAGAPVPASPPPSPRPRTSSRRRKGAAMRRGG